MEGFSSSTVLGALAFLLAFLIAALVHFILGFGRRCGIPGPRGWPYVGVLPHLLRNRDTIHLVLQEWAKQYGKIFTFVMMGERWYVTSDASLITKVALSRPASYAKSKKILETAHEMGFVGVFTTEGETWTRHRKVTAPAFSSLKVASMESTIALVVGRLMEKWDEASRSGQDVDALVDLSKLSLNVMLVISFGLDLNTFEGTSQACEDVLFAFRMLALRVYAPFPSWRFKLLETAEDREYNVCRKRLENLILKAKEKDSDSSKEQAGSDNLLKRLLKSLEEEGEAGVKLTDEEFVGNILTFLLAGQDTTSVTMAWTLFFLATHPEIQAEVYAEVVSVFGSERDLTQEALVGVDANKLKYLTMVIKETMRLKPIFPYITLQPTRSTEISKGLVVHPHDVFVLLNTAAEKSEEHFQRPMEFEPRRWEHDTSGLGTSPGSAPFGWGRRMCPGRFMALSEMQHCLAAICHRFVVTLAPDCPPQSVKEIDVVIMRPTQVRLSLLRRRD